MSTPATVPMFDPNGTLRDIPYERMTEARKAGAIPGVRMSSPDGSIRVVPANRAQEAAQHGGKILPIEQQEIEHPGFWHAVTEDAAGAAKGLFTMAGTIGKGPAAVISDIAVPTAQRIQDQHAADVASGEGFTQRNIVRPAAGLVGVNVAAMDQAAREGDVGGVLGRAVVPTAMAVAPLGAEAVAEGARLGGRAIAPAVRAATRGANKALAKAPGTVGGLAGASLGGAVGGHLGAEIGGAAGAMAGRELLPQVRIPGEGFGLPSRVTGGPAVAPRFEPPSAGAVAPTPISSPGAATPAPIAPRGLNLEAPQTLSGDSALSQILTGQDSANLLKIAKSRGLNVTQETQLRPGVAGPKLIKKIIEDFSPEELEEIRSKYMESTRFRHAFGDIGPEAWKTMSLKTYFPDVKIPAAALKRTESMMQFAKSRTPEVPATAADDLTGILQESLKQAKATGQ